MTEKDKKIIISIFSIVAIIALVSGAVYAYFSFVTNSGNVATTNGKLDIDYNISNPELTGILIPSSSRSGGIMETATAKLKTGSVDAAINFYITPTSIQGFPLSALSYDVDVIDTSDNVVATYSGNFNDAVVNTPLKIVDAHDLSTDLLTFNIYLWLDGSKINNDNFNVNNSFTAVISADTVQITGEFGETIAEHITDLYNNASKSTVTNNSIDYHYATSVKLMNDRLGGTTSSLDGGNIRYYGVNPNNYIDIGDRDTMPWKKIPMFADMFETSEQCYQTADCTTNYANIGQLVGQNFTSAAQCEAAMPSLLASAGVSSVDEICGEIPILWRIIGVFNGKLRIRRNDSIGSYSFDTSDSSVNSGWGINQWGPSGSYEGADLMRLLNPGYEGESVNNSLYWTSGSGTCYNGLSNATTSCDFTNSGLSTTAKKYVVDQTLSLGGFDSTVIYANVAYSTERGTNVIQNPADNVTRTLSWTGKVGLIYPSDYGYAADFTNNNCKSNLYDNSQNCTETWMNGVSWMISPWAAHPDGELGVYDDGFGGSRASNDYGGWPVLTLSSDALLETGDGSKSTPYVLAA